MTRYVNPSTRLGGVEQILVPRMATTVPEAEEFEDAPFDDTQYVRMNGAWVPIDFPEIVPDTLAPSPPVNLNSVGTLNAAETAVDYELTWDAPIHNADGSPLTDLGYYVVRWRYVGYTVWASFVSGEPASLLPGIVLDSEIEWQVLARDTSGNDSTWAWEV